MEKIVVVMTNDCSDCVCDVPICLNYSSPKDFLDDLEKLAQEYIDNNEICDSVILGGVKFSILDFVSDADNYYVPARYYPPQVYTLDEWFDKNFSEHQEKE